MLLKKNKHYLKSIKKLNKNQNVSSNFMKKKRVRLFVTKTSEIVCARLFAFITNLILHILSETNFGINYFWFFDISLTFKDFFNRPYWLQCVFVILLPSIFSSGIVCKWIYRKKSTWHKLSFSAFIFFFFSASSTMDLFLIF